MKFIALIFAVCSIGMSTTIFANESNSNGVHVFIANGTDDNQTGTNSQSNFLCTDTIYAVLDGNWTRDTSHIFEAYWTNPKGKQQEHSRHTFKAHGDTRVWMWLRLHRGDDNAMSRMFGLSEDSMQEFIGEWRVDFWLDGKKVSKSHFSVAC